MPGSLLVHAPLPVHRQALLPKKWNENEPTVLVLNKDGLKRGGKDLLSLPITIEKQTRMTYDRLDAKVSLTGGRGHPADFAKKRRAHLLTKVPPSP